MAKFEEIARRAPEDDEPNYPVALINWMNALIVQAEECDSDAALDETLGLIDRHGHRFDEHPLRLAFLGKQARALLMKAQRTGALDLMRRAVGVQKQRQSTARKGHPEHGACMLDLGITLIHYSTMADSLTEVDEAVAVRRLPGLAGAGGDDCCPAVHGGWGGGWW